MKRYLNRKKITEYFNTPRKILDAPCSNQSLSNIIFYSSLENLDFFLKAVQGEYLRKHSMFPIVKIGNTTYRVYKATENVRGLRARMCIIDDTIPDEIIEQIILPVCNLYCHTLYFMEDFIK